MNIGQIIEYNKINIFLKNHAENKTERVIPDLSLYLIKDLFEVKASDLQISFNIFR